MSPKPLPEGKQTLPGSCHCKAIQFTVSNVDFAMMAKCNCTLCISKGRIGIMVGNNDIKLRLKDGSEKVVNFDNVKTEAPPQLSTYVGGCRTDGGQANMHFCNICGADLFYSESIPVMPENFNNVNLLTLDVSSLGVDYKDLSNPEISTYVNGLDNSWNKRKGEPFENGLW